MPEISWPRTIFPVRTALFICMEGGEGGNAAVLDSYRSWRLDFVLVRLSARGKSWGRDSEQARRCSMERDWRTHGQAALSSRPSRRRRGWRSSSPPSTRNTLSRFYTCTHAHARTHARTNTHTHTHTHKEYVVKVPVCVCVLPCVISCGALCAVACAIPRAFAPRTRTNARTHAHTHTHINARTHTLAL